jgi:hypothetical protein
MLLTVILLITIKDKICNLDWYHSNVPDFFDEQY